MKDETIDEFAVRFYRWSLDDAQRELQKGFPLMRMVKGSATLGSTHCRVWYSNKQSSRSRSL